MALSVAPNDPTQLIIEYCDSAECPGCPPWPDCDCGRIALSEQNAALVPDTIVSKPIQATPTDGNKCNGRKESKRWYKHRSNPRKQNRGKHQGHNHGDRCGHGTPVETVPCMCPLILCAAPPQCDC